MVTTTLFQDTPMRVANNLVTFFLEGRAVFGETIYFRYRCTTYKKRNATFPPIHIFRFTFPWYVSSWKMRGEKFVNSSG